MTQSFNTPFHLESPTGARLHVFSRTSDGKARAILLVHHGMAEHAARYRRFAEAMAQAGFHVYAHDHRGHGATRAADAPIGQFSSQEGWQKVIADAKAVRDEAIGRHPGLPVVLFGHSMGGLTALNTAISHPGDYAGVAVWNANFNGGAAGRAALAILAVERAFKGSDVPSGILPRLTFQAWAKSVSGRRTDFDWLSHDAAAVDAYVADPLCGFDASVSLWRDVFHMIYRGADPASLKNLPPELPLHLLGGKEDPATENGKAVTWLADRMAAAGLHDVTLRIENGFRHETLNETDAHRPIAAFVEWAEEVADKAERKKNA